MYYIEKKKPKQKIHLQKPIFNTTLILIGLCQQMIKIIQLISFDEIRFCEDE